MYSSFRELDAVRKMALREPVADNWDRNKRKIKIPVAVGMAGIGKSSFAREGLQRHLNNNSADTISEDDFLDRFKPGKYLNLRIGEFSHVTGHPE